MQSAKGGRRERTGRRGTHLTPRGCGPLNFSMKYQSRGGAGAARQAEVVQLNALNPSITRHFHGDSSHSLVTLPGECGLTLIVAHVNSMHECECGCPCECVSS